MSLPQLDNLVRIRQLKAEAPAQSEIDGLIRSGTVRPKDAQVENLSLDSRFDLAYNAAHAFSVAALRWHGYRSERLLNQSILAVCSPTLLRSAQTAADLAALLPRHLIHIMGYENHWLRVRLALALGDVPASACPTVDTTIAALELAAAGAGIALAHGIFLDAYVATGRLVRALPQEFADDNSYFVITPERPQRIRREVQLFRDWLLAIASS